MIKEKQRYCGECKDFMMICLDRGSKSQDKVCGFFSKICSLSLSRRTVRYKNDDHLLYEGKMMIGNCVVCNEISRFEKELTYHCESKRGWVHPTCCDDCFKNKVKRLKNGFKN